jgi:uncharacterized protein (TIGR02147 family)
LQLTHIVIDRLMGRGKKMDLENITNQDHKEKVVSKPSIFDFTDYSDFLNSYVQAYGKYSHGPYNLKNWALRLGYKSPSSLAMVLGKQRLPTWRMILSFSEDFKLSKQEKKYFELLVEIEKKKKSGADVSVLIKEACKLSGSREYQKINLDQFSVISDWYCYVIKRLVSNRFFVYDLDWIFRALRKKVTKPQIKTAIENLKNVGLLAEDVEKGLVDQKMKIHTGDQIPSAAIRNHHRGMINGALDALEEQTVDERLFQTLTLNINKKERLDEAFDDIRQFINDFNDKYSNEASGDSVYQLNAQLFEHTRKLEEINQ